MESELRWRFVLLRRIVANAVVGGLGLIFPTMIGGVIAGATWDWLSHAADLALNIPPASGSPPHLGAYFIGFNGGISLGFLIGLILFAVSAARTPPGRTFETLRALLVRVAVGIIAGAIGFCSLFLALEWAVSALTGKGFYVQAVSDSGLLFWGTIALMICGAIAGALAKRA